MRMRGLLLVPLAMVLVLASGAHARSSASATVADDVRLLGRTIEESHPDPFRSVTRARFRSDVGKLVAQAPTMSHDELLVGILKLTASLGPRNGHTSLFPLDPSHERELHLYPLRLYDFADGLFVVDDAQGGSLTGSKLVAVAGEPIGKVLARVQPLVSRDNESNLRGMTPHYLLVAEVLHGLEITPDAGRATFTFERRGTRTDVSLAPIPGHDYVSVFSDPLYGHYPSILPMASRPLYLASSGRQMWARTLANGRAVYFGYNAVVPPSPSFLRKLERLVKGKAVRRVIVDARLNGGGDNTTYGPLTALLGSQPVNRRGKLYLLSGRATFSAAANFAAEIDRDTRAIIVGEPTGGGVETYGDTVPVLLPTAGWTVHVATRYHDRRRGPNDRRLAVEPDIPIDLASADYFAGRDPALERALKGL